jgi:hypothetical protein
MHCKISDIRRDIQVGEMMMDDENGKAKESPEAIKLRQVHIL